MWVIKDYKGRNVVYYSESEYKELENKYNITVKQYNRLEIEYKKLLNSLK